MNLSAFSPAFVLIFVFALLWILMGIRYQALSRSQKWLVLLVLLPLALFNHTLRNTLGSELYSKTIFLTLHLPTFLLFWRLTRSSACKMCFMILSALVFTAPTVIVGNIAKQFMPFDPLLTQLAANLLGYAAILLLAKFVFQTGFNYMLKYGDDRLFLQMSVVPLLYYFYVLAVANIDFSSVPSTFAGYFVRHVPTLEVFVFYFVLMQNYKDLSERRELEATQTALNQQLDAAENQIALLNEAQMKTAVYQHDMRHHLTVIEACLASNEIVQAREYIIGVQADIAAITPRHFCENEVVNLLCSSFASRSEQLGCRMTVEARLPRALPLPDTELTSLLSNGLENALTAVADLPEAERTVSLFCAVRHNKLLLEIRNPYSGDITMDAGLPISNQPGHGYGCRSIRTIAERYRGLCSFETADSTFTLRVALPMDVPGTTGSGA